MKKKMSIEQAYKLAKDYGVKFTGNYYADVNSSEAKYLSDLSKVVGYKKPANATGSTAVYFYNYLYKKFNK